MSLSQVYLEWEQKTEARGLQQGLQQGLQHERSLILKLLTRRIGPLSSTTSQQIESLSLEQLESLGEALLDFASPEDLTHWLQTVAPGQ